MASVAAGATVNLVLAIGQVLSVVTIAGGSATVNVGGSATALGASARSQAGPFEVPVRCSIVAAGAAADFQTAQPGEIAPVGATPFNATATLTTASQAALRAAQGTGVAQCVTEITYQNTSATATLVTIQDGGAALRVVSAPASMANPVTVPIGTPLQGTAATALNAIAGTTAANVIIYVSGYNRHT
jgi:hypothetical protein